MYIQVKISLYDRSESGLPVEDTFLPHLVQLDTLILNIQLKAEIKCCKKRTRYDWSDEIHFTKQCLLYWHTKRKRITRGRDTDSICQGIYVALPREHHQLYINTASGSARKNWFLTKGRLKQLMAHHRRMLADSRHELLDNEAKFIGSTVEQVKAKHDKTKRDKKLYTTLRHHFHPSNRSGITHLLLPDTDINGAPTSDVDQATQ